MEGLFISWILAIIVISYIVITETKRQNKIQDCPHKHTHQYTDEKGTRRFCDDCKTKIKNKKR